MKRFTEDALWIPCAGDQMLGILARPAVEAARTAVLIVPGGPQYRAGSHRQFTRLSRELAAAGHASLRFDVRGMGDSSGEPRQFTELDDDIAAAASALRERFPGVPLVLLGLCDAASAILLALVGRTLTPDGLVLLNPWVRSEATLAQTQLKHYYRARLTQRDFWRKLARGDFDARGSLRELLQKVRSVRSSPARSETYQEKMARGLQSFAGPVLLICSENDLTAREFSDHAAADTRWRELLRRPQVTQRNAANADHTFSATAAADLQQRFVSDWLNGLPALPSSDVKRSEPGAMAVG